MQLHAIRVVTQIIYMLFGVADVPKNSSGY